MSSLAVLGPSVSPSATSAMHKLADALRPPSASRTRWWSTRASPGTPHGVPFAELPGTVRMVALTLAWSFATRVVHLAQ